MADPLDDPVQMLMDAAEKVLTRAPGFPFQMRLHQGHCLAASDPTSCRCGINDLRYALEVVRQTRLAGR